MGSDARIDPRRKAVQAAEAKAFAQEAEEEAERLEAVSGDITSLNEFKAGLKAAVRNPGALVTRKPAERAAVLAEERAAEIEAARLAEIEEAKRPKAIEAFTEQQLKRVDEYFPTPAKRWRFAGFVVMKPDSLKTSFGSMYRFQLKDDEVQNLQKSMLRRWVDRIVEDLSALKPAKNNWMALTGGSPEAATTLKNGLEVYPEYGEKLRPVIEKHEADNAPKPAPKPPKRDRDPGPSGGGPSM